MISWRLSVEKQTKERESEEKIVWTERKEDSGYYKGKEKEKNEFMFLGRFIVFLEEEKREKAKSYNKNNKK